MLDESVGEAVPTAVGETVAPDQLLDKLICGSSQDGTSGASDPAKC